MIIKEVKLELTEEEIGSSEDIEIRFTVSQQGVEVGSNEDASVTYTITYPKS